MKRYLFTTLSLVVCCVFRMNAQVTIGKVEEPKGFSILQLEGEGKKALRIPQLTSEERDQLTDSEEFKDKMTDEAKGLVIYNKTTKTFQYWNGELWTEL